MYQRFFALTKTPFSLVPDPDCIHLTAQHADAISGLAFGVLARKGYLVLTAEAGLGKTTALRALSQILSESNVQASLIFAPTLTGSEFLELALLNFGFKDIPTSKAQRLKLLEEFVFRSEAEGRTLALIVDEAHQLSPELLEEVRLLGNFESNDSKLIQIVLVGQNELNDRLNLPELWQLKQRIAIRLSLRRLDREAVEEYIRFRWAKAGGEDPTPFTGAALDGIASWSKGIPRLINVICDNALLIAFSATIRTVGLQTVREACEELALPTPAIAAHAPSFTGAKPLMSPPEKPLLQTKQKASPEVPPDAWVAPSPSLAKRWSRLRGSEQRRPSRSRTSILSLNEPWP
jgi:general secretion pathway protein A